MDQVVKTYVYIHLYIYIYIYIELCISEKFRT